LHHLLAQSAVFLNLALNTIAIGPQLFPQPSKATNESLIAGRPSSLAQQPRQFGGVRRDPPRLVFAEEVRCAHRVTSGCFRGT
jgi:hypothetical protein